MTALLVRLRAGLVRDARVDLSYPFFLPFTTLTALFSPLLFYFVARFVGDGVDDQLASIGGDYFSFVLVGLLWATFLFVATRVYSAGMREAQLTGLLEALLQTPTRGWTLLLAQGGWPYTVATFHSVVILAISTAVLGVDLDVDPAGFLLAAVLSLAAITAVGLAMAAAVLVVKRGEGIVNLAASALVLLGGLYYPVSSLPAPLDTIGEILPVSHAVDALRETMLVGKGPADVAADLWPVALFALVGLPVAAALVERAIESCRRQATLGQY